MPNAANDLVLSASVIDVLTQNPGLNMTIGDAARFTLEGGCVRLMRYGDNSKDLDYVLFDNGNSLSSSQTANLKDFRESFSQSILDKFYLRLIKILKGI